MRRLRSALFHLIYGKAAGLRPLRSIAPQAIVLSPGFYLTDKNLPPEGHGHFRFAASQQFII